MEGGVGKCVGMWGEGVEKWGEWENMGEVWESVLDVGESEKRCWGVGMVRGDEGVRPVQILDIFKKSFLLLIFPCVLMKK